MQNPTNRLNNKNKEERVFFRLPNDILVLYDVRLILTLQRQVLFQQLQLQPIEEKHL